jgi:hypothetical protein
MSLRSRATEAHSNTNNVVSRAFFGLLLRIIPVSNKDTCREIALRSRNAYIEGQFDMATTMAKTPLDADQAKQIRSAARRMWDIKSPSHIQAAETVTQRSTIQTLRNSDSVAFK